MNTRLLKRVARHVDAEPKRLNMGEFLVRKSGEEDEVYDGFAMACDAYPYAKCGTAACIAGWAVLLSGKRPSNKSIELQAAKLLDIEPGLGWGAQEHEADRLFYVHSWPTKYSEAYEQARTPRGKATVAVRRIMHFIKTKGAK